MEKEELGSLGHTESIATIVHNGKKPSGCSKNLVFSFISLSLQGKPIMTFGRVLPFTSRK